MATQKTTQLDVIDKVVSMAKADGFEMTRDRVELIKSQVAKGSTDDEFLFFMALSTKRHLDPLAKQIYFTKRKVKQSDGSYKEQMTVITGIEGLTLIAERSGKFAGLSKPIFKENEQNKPISCEMTIYKFGPNGQRYEAATTICFFDEYKPSAGMDFMWNKMPHNMIEKVTKAKLLRAAFPEELSGLYEEDEVPQVQDYDIPSEKPVDARPVHEINKEVEPMNNIQRQAIRECNNILKWKPEQFNMLCQHKFNKDLRDLTIAEAEVLIDLMKENVESLGESDKLVKEEPKVPGEGIEMASQQQIAKVFALLRDKGLTKDEFYKANDIQSLTKVTKARATRLIEELINMPEKVETIEGEVLVDKKTGEIIEEKHISEMTDEEAEEAIDAEFNGRTEKSNGVSEITKEDISTPLDL